MRSLSYGVSDKPTQGHQHDPTHCQDGYQDLRKVSLHPVVQRSHYRLVFRRHGQIPDGGHLHSRVSAVPLDVTACQSGER
jgi:hypothetical protein